MMVFFLAFGFMYARAPHQCFAAPSPTHMCCAPKLARPKTPSLPLPNPHKLSTRIRDAVGAFAAGDFAWRNSICAWSLSHQTTQPLVLEDVLNDAR